MGSGKLEEVALLVASELTSCTVALIAQHGAS